MNKSGFTAVDGSKDCLSRGLIFLAFFAMIFECSATYASSFVIVPTYDSTITSDSNAATIEATINSTIGVYEATFTDPITVNITFQEMNSGLGQSSTSFDTILYSSYLTALTADAKSSNDAVALAHLGPDPEHRAGPCDE